MKQENDLNENPLAPIVIKLSNIVVLLIAVVVALLIVLAVYIPAPEPAKSVETPVPDKNGLYTSAAKDALSKVTENEHYWKAPDATDLAENKNAELIKFGEELIRHTSLYFGPKGKIFKAATNGLNCQNCHLDAGTKVFGNNYALVASTYPKYRARSGKVENIYKRVNDCFERSLNGRSLDTASNEMQALAAYINWVGKDVTKNNRPEGLGMKDLAVMERAADPEKGKEVYSVKCQSCHQANGEGVLNGDQTEYTYPPLWGSKSYNIGAGLYRVSTFARFVKNNMPLGASHNSVQLSDEEAWDVSAFVNSQEHPKVILTNDWPRLHEKPFDHPFGPYVDGFSEKQHKYGPFQPIIDKLSAIKNSTEKKTNS